MKPASNRIPQEKTQYVYCRDTLLSGVSRKHTGRKKKEVALIQFGVREAKSQKKKNDQQEGKHTKKRSVYGLPFTNSARKKKKVYVWVFLFRNTEKCTKTGSGRTALGRM